MWESLDDLTWSVAGSAAFQSKALFLWDLLSLWHTVIRFPQIRAAVKSRYGLLDLNAECTCKWKSSVLECRAASQKDLERLEKWADGNLVEFSQGILRWWPSPSLEKLKTWLGQGPEGLAASGTGLSRRLDWSPLSGLSKWCNSTKLIAYVLTTVNSSWINWRCGESRFLIQFLLCVKILYFVDKRVRGF